MHPDALRQLGHLMKNCSLLLSLLGLALKAALGTGAVVGLRTSGRPVRAKVVPPALA